MRKLPSNLHGCPCAHQGRASAETVQIFQNISLVSGLWTFGFFSVFNAGRNVSLGNLGDSRWKKKKCAN
jgi:hypothetical protein